MTEPMTNETQTDRLADAYYVRKNGYYCRPNAQGYTVVEAEAGRFTLDEAIRYSHPNGPDGPRDGIRYEPVPAQTDRLAEVLESDRVAAGEIDAALDVTLSDHAYDELVLILIAHRTAATHSLSTDLANAQQRVEQLEGALVDAAASLAASLSILQRANSHKKQPRLVVASNAMFATMMIDYQKSLDHARAALTTGKERT